MIRLGLSSVRNLGGAAADRVAVGRPYRDLEDFATRTQLPAAALEALATAGAFGCFGLSRRAALWAAGAAASLREGQLPGTATGLTAPPLPAMTPTEETLADLWATSTYGTHPVVHIRAALNGQAGIDRSSGQVGAKRFCGRRGRAGHPPEAAAHRVGRGVLSEDETGMVNVDLPASRVGTPPADGHGGPRPARPGPGGAVRRRRQPGRRRPAPAPGRYRRPQPRLPVMLRIPPEKSAYLHVDPEWLQVIVVVHQL